MKLTSMQVSVVVVVGSWLLEQAVLFGSAFSASGFDASGTIGDDILGDPAPQDVEQSACGLGGVFEHHPRL